MKTFIQLSKAMHETAPETMSKPMKRDFLLLMMERYQKYYKKRQD